MYKSSWLYRFAKKCEVPPTNSRFWLVTSVIYNVGMVSLGNYFLWSMTRKCNRNAKYVLLPTQSNGDVLLLYRCLNVINNCNNIDEPTLLISKKMEKIANCIFPHKCIGLSPFKLTAISKAFLFENDYDNIVFSWPWVYMNVFLSIKPLPLSFHEGIPNKIHTYLGQDAKKGKCVILSPGEASFAAHNEHRPKDIFWIKLAQRLNYLGLSVYTNCDGNMEEPILGTQILYPPFEELAGVVEFAGYSVSLRSGFTDWSIAAPSAKHVILYPSQKYFDQFSVSKMWNKKDTNMEIIYNYSMDEIIINKLIDKIILYFEVK